MGGGTLETPGLLTNEGFFDAFAEVYTDFIRNIFSEEELMHLFQGVLQVFFGEDHSADKITEYSPSSIGRCRLLILILVLLINVKVMILL